MKNKRHALQACIFGWAILLFTGSHAIDPIIPDLPTLSSNSYFLMDYHTDTVIAEKAADERLGPASITKLMTAYILYQMLDEGIIQIDDKVKISQKARQAEGSRMYLEQGSEVSVRELLQGMVIQSGNDASIALAEHAAGEEAYFVAMMNARAKELGMNNSHFVNVAGFPDKDHYMSARDIAVLSQAMIRNFPQHYEMYSQKEYTYNDIKQYNRNQLLWRDPSVDGLKTGYTESAQYCLAVSAQRDDMRLISVVLKSPSGKQRFTDAKRLLSYGFRFYKTHVLYPAQESLHQMRVWGGEQKHVQVGITEDFYITLPRHTKGKLQIEKAVQDSLSAPVQLGQVVGSVSVYLNDDFSQTAPLAALETVVQGSWFIRLTDSFLKLFN